MTRNDNGEEVTDQPQLRGVGDEYVLVPEEVDGPGPEALVESKPGIPEGVDTHEHLVRRGLRRVPASEPMPCIPILLAQRPRLVHRLG
jgi:hypothetical protein